MLLEPKNDLLHLLNIIQSCEKIVLFSKEYTNYEDFYYDKKQMVFDACLMLLQHTGESIKKVSEETKSQRTEIKWENIVGFRNRISHEYAFLNPKTVFKIIKDEIPYLSNACYEIVKDYVEKGIFDKDEIAFASKHEFYDLVNFNIIIN